MTSEGSGARHLSISRRTFLKLAGSVLTGPAGVACSQQTRQTQVAETEPRFGGMLRVAIAGEPPSLDPSFTTAYLTRQIALHMFELLLHQDQRYNPVPMLVESFGHEDGGRALRLNLRTGVQFHNGQPMTADDVVASLLRYARLTGYGRTLFARVAEAEKIGAYSVRIIFKEPTGVGPVFLSAHADAPVIPRQLAEAYPDSALKEFIGTGPYRLAEHLPDRYVSLKRYENYSPVDRTPSGNSGRKVPYLDEIRFIPVPEPAVRLDGVVTGEFHFAQELNPDSYDQVKANPNLEVQVVRTAWYCAHFNKAEESILSNRTLHHALLAAFNVEPVARLAFGRPEFYRMYPSMSAPETPWYSEAGR
jgi:peptide/nickel transport system substrate-binding protein